MTAAIMRPVCPVTPGCTGSGDHVCSVLRPLRRASSALEEEIAREVRRNLLRRLYKVTL